MGNPFTLDDDGSEVFSGLEPGDYTITESVAAGWLFDKVECEAVDWGPGADSAPTVTVHLQDGEAAVCTFYNTDTDAGGPGELSCTGDSYLLPVLLAGLWALLMGLGLAVWSWMKEADASW